MVLGIVISKTGSDIIIDGAHYTIPHSSAIEPGDTVEVCGQHATVVRSGYWHGMKLSVMEALNGSCCTAAQFEQAVGFRTAHQQGEGIARSIFCTYFAGKRARWIVDRVVQEWDGYFVTVLFAGCQDKFDLHWCRNAKRPAVKSGTTVELRFEFWMSERLEGHECALLEDSRVEPIHCHERCNIDMELLNTSIARPLAQVTDTSSDRIDVEQRVPRDGEWWYYTDIADKRQYYGADLQSRINAAWNSGKAEVTGLTAESDRILFDTSVVDGRIVSHSGYNVQVQSQLKEVRKVAYAPPAFEITHA